MSEWQTVIGLEVHAEMETESKMFSNCPVVDSVEAEPNSAVDALSLGMPGNAAGHQHAGDGIRHHGRLGAQLRDSAGQSIRAQELLLSRPAQRAIRSANTTGRWRSTVYINIELEDGSSKRIRVRRAHMEEDTGKLSHIMGGSLVDYNRAGVPAS